MSKERGIIQSAKQVRQWLAGTRTQFRVPLKDQPVISKGYMAADPCPFGRPGDRLWVKETFLHSKAEYAYEVSCSVPFIPEDTVYAADVTEGSVKGCGFTSPVAMPRRLSRITLEITSVRVELAEQDEPVDKIKAGQWVWVIETKGVEQRCGR